MFEKEFVKPWQRKAKQFEITDDAYIEDIILDPHKENGFRLFFESDSNFSIEGYEGKTSYGGKLRCQIWIKTTGKNKEEELEQLENEDKHIKKLKKMNEKVPSQATLKRIDLDETEHKDSVEKKEKEECDNEGKVNIDEENDKLENVYDDAESRSDRLGWEAENIEEVSLPVADVSKGETNTIEVEEKNVDEQLELSHECDRTGQQLQAMEIQIIDEDEIFNVYSFLITRKDYESLVEKQELPASFNEFKDLIKRYFECPCTQLDDYIISLNYDNGDVNLVVSHKLGFKFADVLTLNLRRLSKEESKIFAQHRYNRLRKNWLTMADQLENFLRNVRARSPNLAEHLESIMLKVE